MRPVKNTRALAPAVALILFGLGGDAFGQSYAGSTVKIIGAFPIDGSGKAFNLETTIEFGEGGKVVYDGGGEYSGTLNGDAKGHIEEHTLSCTMGKKETVIKTGRHSAFFQSWMKGYVYTQMVSSFWMDSAKSRNCDRFLAASAVSEVITVDLSQDDCTFIYRLDIVSRKAEALSSIEPTGDHHLGIKGRCEASGPITKIGVKAN